MVYFNSILSLKINKKGFCKKKSGRNNSGKIVTYRRGGGSKRSYKRINFFGFSGVAVVESIEKDSTRNCFLCRLFAYGGLKSQRARFYIPASDNIFPGQMLVSEKVGRLRLGNRCRVGTLPIGTFLHCIGSDLRPQKAVYQRSAGVFGQVVQKSNLCCTLKFSSGKIKEIVPNVCCVLGSGSNRNYHYKKLSKAGISRRYGKRPCVRGVAMNPIDHPHGGGEGKTSGGRPSVTPWSRPMNTKNK